MAQHGKKFTDATRRFDRDHLFTPAEALELAKQLAPAKFDETVELAVRLGVDPRKADQIVRGTVALPAGTGKDVRVAVFAAGDAAAEARAAGADHVGADDLAAQVEGGMLDFDVAIATPDLMPMVGRLGRVLGPRGLMPNPKTGTVTTDVGKAVEDFKGGKVEYRTDRYGNIHVPLGKVELRAREAERELPGRHRRAQPGQAGVGQGPLHPQGRGVHDDGPRHQDRPRPFAGRRHRRLKPARAAFASATLTLSSHGAWPAVACPVHNPIARRRPPVPSRRKPARAGGHLRDPYSVAFADASPEPTRGGARAWRTPDRRRSPSSTRCASASTAPTRRCSPSTGA